MEGNDDWSTMSVEELRGTELEWSTVLPATRGAKQKRNVCLFCQFSYLGGPFKVRQHLDRQIKKREVCACRYSSNGALR
jgi:hypothetical protein